MTEHHDRCISLILYGFQTDPKLLAEEVGSGDVEWLRVGDLVGNRTSDRNRITWRYPLHADTRWDDGLSALLEQLGGVDRVQRLLRDVEPKAAWVRVNFPVQGSPWQESNGLGREAITMLARLNLEFDVAVFDYDDGRATHRQLESDD